MNTSAHLEDLAERFQFLQVLGSGSFGTVWLVRDRHHEDEERALKLEKIDSQQAMENAQTNFDILQTLRKECKHFVCVHYLFWGTLNGQRYLCTLMDYVKGPDLYKLIMEQKHEAPLSHKELKELYEEILFLHRNGIVHGDVGLRNII